MRRGLGLRRTLLLGAASSLIGGWALPATAADLGGDCCADLEERIAELEATTARKGNRKVSLTVSGWISEEIAFWDDGTERNAYVGTNPVEQSRVRFVGEAKIDKDWSSGYTLEIGVFGANGGKWDQITPDGTSPNSLLVRKSSWFLKSNKLGKLTVGQDGTSTYHLLDEADGRGDPAASARLADEREMLLAELRAATGVGGRRRRTGSTDERARVAVRKAIASAIVRIEARDPALARLLRDTVRTGGVCSYTPQPDRPVHWIL